MKEPENPWQGMTPDLLALLDEEITLLGLRTRQFDDLYEAILHRRDEQMESLLEEMTAAQHRQAELDEKLQAMRTLFARALQRPMREIRLSDLIGLLDGEPKTHLREKRQQIILLAERLKRKHVTTAILLGESARINRLFLESLLPQTDAVTTYGTSGAKPWRTSSGLVDAEM
jgi:flagellar biosynthesis/type III secretory pathway chaperone